MAGLEVVVRPVVFPNIRPPLPRILAPADKPDQGIATFSGSSGRLIDLPHSFSVSFSQQKKDVESKRMVNVERIHQMDDNGEINKDNYIDVERTTQSRFETEDGTPLKVTYGQATVQADNIIIKEWNKVLQVPMDLNYLFISTNPPPTETPPK